MGGPASWPYREREGRFGVVAIVACQELMASGAGGRRPGGWWRSSGDLDVPLQFVLA